MAVRSIVKMGDPRLLQKSELIKEFDTPELQQLIEDMQDTRKAFDGTGLAAPQIGILKRVLLFEVQAHSQYPDDEPIPTTILINPSIEILTEDTNDGWEGCISIPDMYGLVSRPTHIRYTGFDLQGNRIEREARNWHARVVLHENDHLDGILYPVRMHDMRYFGFIDSLPFK